jgi:hypothetical protein
VNRLKLVTIQKKLPPVSIERPTEEISAERVLIDREEAPATARMAQTAAIPVEKPVEKASDSMEIDPPASNSLADTHQPPKSPEVRILTKEEKIRLLVKEHVALWKRFIADLPLGASEGNRALLTRAQDSQRALQKMIPRTEVEEYVEGWNPWTAKKDLFPVLQQERGGKKRSSSSRASSSAKTEDYDDPRRWKKLMKVCKTLENGYRHMD